MSLSWVRVRFALTALLVSTLVAGCGGAATEAPAGQAALGVFPVSVEHKYGTTEIKTAPSRVVTLGLSDQDAVLAFGVKPVGVVDWFKERPFGKWPWTQPLWGSTPPEIVGERDEFNLEKIAALKPDLILAEYSGLPKEQYEKLSKLAPVVAQPPKFDDFDAPWQEMTRMVGRALGQPAKADELIAGIDKRFAQVRAEHPEFAKQTMVVADTYEPGNYGAFAVTDPKMVFMAQLGYKKPERFKELFKAGQDTAEVPSERLDFFDVDRLVWLSSDAAAEQRVRADPVYQRLKVAQAKKDLFVSYEDPPIGAAISFSTVLSLPYALDRLVPKLTEGTN